MLKPLNFKPSKVSITNPEIVRQTSMKTIDGPRLAGRIPTMIILSPIQNYLNERAKNQKIPPQETPNLIACYGQSRKHSLMLVYCFDKVEAAQELEVWKSVPECQAFFLEELEKEVIMCPVKIAV